MSNINKLNFNETIATLERAINDKSVWIDDGLKIKKKSSSFVRFIAVILNWVGIDILSHVRTHKVADTIFKFAEINKNELTADSAVKLMKTLEWLKARTGSKYEFTILKTKAAINGLLNDKKIASVTENGLQENLDNQPAERIPLEQAIEEAEYFEPIPPLPQTSIQDTTYIRNTAKSISDFEKSLYITNSITKRKKERQF